MIFFQIFYERAALGE
jgi:hypothetical protein